MNPNVERFRKMYAEMAAEGEGQIPANDIPQSVALLMEYEDACELMKSADDGLASDEVDTHPSEIRKRVHANGRDWHLIVPVDASNFLEDNNDDDDSEREDDSCA
jgi:hypothetical protein